MTIVATIPSPESPTVEDVMAHGVCTHCRKPIAGHINPETKAWMGCDFAREGEGELPQTGAHPLRRATDIVIMVPLTVLTNALTTVVVPRQLSIVNEEAPTIGPPTERRINVARPARAPRGTHGTTRGKPAGRYVSTGKQPSKMTEAMNRVWFAMKNNKRGIVAKQLSERLSMPEGTLAWALAQLVKEGAIVHVRPGQHADALIAAANK